MEIAEMFVNESREETMKFIDSKRNWDVVNQRYRRSESEFRKVNLIGCQIYWRGEYLIVEYDGIIHWWETGSRNYFEQAIEFMQLLRPAEWKTLDRLLSLRMGIRQTEVNCCGYVESLLEGEEMTLHLYNKFMRLARAHDKEHHGSSTF